MNWHHSSSIQLVISDLNDIAADLYRHRIRPASKKGGNGVYDTSQGGPQYVLPGRLSSNIRATFAVTKLSADYVSLVAISSENPACCVTANVDSRGRLTDIILPGQASERSEDPPVAALRVSRTSQAAQAHHTMFFDDMS